MQKPSSHPPIQFAPIKALWIAKFGFLPALALVFAYFCLLVWVEASLQVLHRDFLCAAEPQIIKY